MRDSRLIPWALILASVHGIVAAQTAQRDDPISSGAFEFERSAACAPIKRQSGDVFSGPRGYFVDKREIEASGDRDRIWVEERFVLRNRGKSCPRVSCAGRRCGQVQVRLPLPPHAGVGEACVRASLDKTSDKTCVPISYQRDTQSKQTLVLNLPMLQPDETRHVMARYVLPAVPLWFPDAGNANRAWLSATLPPRGLDQRAVDKIAIIGRAGDSGARQIRDTGLSVDLQIPTSQPARSVFGNAQRIIVVLDRSPSMDGPAGGRVARFLVALLDLAPADTKFRFAYLRGDLLLDPAFSPVETLSSLQSLLHPPNPPSKWLRAATATGSLNTLFIEGVRRGDRVVIVGDGALYLDRAANAFFRRARRRGVTVDMINLDPRAAEPALVRLVRRTGGAVREIGLRWGLVPRHLLDGYVRGALEYGASEMLSGSSVRGWKRAAMTDLVEHVRERKPAAAGRGVPAESALRMLREQLVPAARGCLRQDRRGRAAHSRRATFEFELTRQEIEGLRVKGSLPEPLRSCLYDAAAKLTVPRFEGRVRVRYPIYTEALDVPPTVELRPQTRALLDDLIGAPKSASSKMQKNAP